MSVIASVKVARARDGFERGALVDGAVDHSQRMPTGSASCSANGVGSMPRGVRRNSSSPSSLRKRASALLTAGCVMPSACATFDTRRSRQQLVEHDQQVQVDVAKLHRTFTLVM